MNGEFKDLDVAADEILKDCREISIKMLQEIIRQMNEDFREDKVMRRELGLVIKEKDRPRSLLTTLGQIDFARDYFYDKGNEEYISVLDHALGIEKYERIGGTVAAALVSEAAEVSYAKAASTVTGGAVSRQTVRNQILKVNVPEVQPPEEKRIVKELHVYADEDHVHMQKPGKAKGKQSRIVPLVTVTEGMQEESKGRNRTIHPMHFTSERFDTKELWKSSEGYIGKTYDLEKLEKIYVHGDGGQWIRNGLDAFTQTVHVADEFHFRKALKKVCSILPNRNIKISIENALRQNDHRKADKFIQELLKEPLTEKETKAVCEFAGYLFRFWDEIRIRITEDIPGSCTEGLISHVLSERISRDPLGWSKEGLGKVVSIRVYLKNGGKLTKEAFRQGPSERPERYSEYADRLIEEHLWGAEDFSIFETEPAIMDGASGTQQLIKRYGRAQNTLLQ